MAVQPTAAYLQMLTRSPRSTTTWAVWLGPYLEPLELVADTVLLNGKVLTVDRSAASRTSFGGTAPANVRKACAQARKRFLSGAKR